MKWGIIQFCFMNVIIGYISIVLYSDKSWGEEVITPSESKHLTPGNNNVVEYVYDSIDNYFSLIRLLSTLICLYAANMFKNFQQSRILEDDFDNKAKQVQDWLTPTTILRCFLILCVHWWLARRRRDQYGWRFFRSRSTYRVYRFRWIVWLLLIL